MPAGRYALIPSPFVGASCWRPLAAVMPGAVAVDYGVLAGPDWHGGVARSIAAQVDDQAWIAVLHSGAGGFAPALIAEARRLSGFIFVDAVLPSPGRSWLDSAPAGLARRLQRLANGGRIPPWNTWFADDPTPRLIPDTEPRTRFIADLPSAPLGFLSARSPVTSECEDVPSAYVQLSGAYSDEAARARGRGWPVQVAELHHLAILTHPVQVAEILRTAAPAG